MRTAVLRPLKEKSNAARERRESPRGKSIACGLPERASWSMCAPPGYGRPSSLATLSKASPAASSRVWPRARYSPGARTSYSEVWPPETTRPSQGGTGARSESSTAIRCPSMWLTPTSGILAAAASDFATWTPTSRAPTRPGPRVTAIPSRLRSPHPAFLSASSRTGSTRCRWSREASSGTTPPHFSWTSVCVWTTSDSTLPRRPSPVSTTAAAVSSQLVSRPRTRMWRAGVTLSSEVRENHLHVLREFAGGLELEKPSISLARVRLPPQRMVGGAEQQLRARAARVEAGGGLERVGGGSRPGGLGGRAAPRPRGGGPQLGRRRRRDHGRDGWRVRRADGAQSRELDVWRERPGRFSRRRRDAPQIAQGLRLGACGKRHHVMEAHRLARCDPGASLLHLPPPPLPPHPAHGREDHDARNRGLRHHRQRRRGHPLLQRRRARHRSEDPFPQQSLDGGHGREIVHRREIDGRAQRPHAIEASQDPIQVIGQVGEASFETDDVHGNLPLEWSLLRHAAQLVDPAHRLHQRRLGPAVDSRLARGSGEVDPKLAALPRHQPPESGFAAERAELRVDHLAVAHPDPRELAGALAAQDGAFPPGLDPLEHVQQPEVAHRAGQTRGKARIGEATSLEEVLEPLHDLLEEDRLDQVVVRASLDRLRFRRRRGICPEHEDDDPGEPLLSPRGAAERDAVGRRQGCVDHHRLRARP